MFGFNEKIKQSGQGLGELKILKPQFGQNQQDLEENLKALRPDKCWLYWYDFFYI